jgi:serine protease Do
MKRNYPVIWLTVLAVSLGGAGTWAAQEEMNQEEGVKLLRQTSQAFTAVAEKAVPAVVAVQVEQAVRRGRQQFGSPFDEDFFERFFGPRFRQYQQPREERRVGQGSGFIISEDGYVLTNYHVVGEADKITLTTADGRKFDEVELVGADEKTDIALLKIQDVSDLPVIELGDSDAMRIGEWVIAVGNPFGLTETVTVGVVSAKGRQVHGNEDVYEDFIQTDAAINPGNSGGPLLNLDGKAIGVNSAIVTGTGGYMGIGLAIPINMAKSIVDQLKETGEVVRGYAGIRMQDLTDEIARALDLKIRRGAIVTWVEDGSPAAKAGLKEQDVIVEINGRQITGSQDVKNIIGFTAPGKEVEITVNRDGKQRTLTLVTGKQPATAEVETKLGMRVRDNGDERGVEIAEVEPGSAAASVGLEAGMTILSINRRPVNTVRDFNEAIAAAREAGARSVALFVRGETFTYYVTLPLEK